jgi:hypothetical protein
MSDINTVGSVFIGVVFAVIIILRWLNERNRERDKLKPAPTASIEEKVTATAFGQFCMFLLGVTAFVTTLMFIGAKTVFNEMEAGIFLIAGTLLFGLGIAIGRTRSYAVYQPEGAKPENEPAAVLESLRATK